MPSIPYIAKPVLTARDAIASHVRWKITLLTAARMHEPLSQRANHSIQHPEECSIGQWLLSRYMVHLRGTPEYRAVVDRHVEFHREMQAVALLINSGDYAAAEHLLNAYSTFQLASIAIANAIMALERASSTALAS